VLVEQIKAMMIRLLASFARYPRWVPLLARPWDRRHRSGPVLGRSKPRPHRREPISRGVLPLSQCCARGRTHSGLVAYRTTWAVLLIGASLVGCQGPPKDSFSPPGSDTAGRKIYVAKCARCHKLYNPAKYSDSDWQMWMAKMVKKAKLNPDQQQQLTHYLDSELRHPEGTNAPASP
jgi:hypothetical protein